MKKPLIFIVLAFLPTSGCKKTVKIDNPFFSTSEVPPFEKIKTAHCIIDAPVVNRGLK